MNNNDELRRLRRFIVISWSLLLGAMLGLTLWAAVEIRGLHNVIQLAALTRPQLIEGIAGRDGQDGADGLSIEGPRGSDGSDATPEQIAAAVSTYITLNPPKTEPGPAGTNGTDGEDGVDGLTLEIRLDPSTCQLQSKYSVADSWSFLAQLPTPCVGQP